MPPEPIRYDSAGIDLRNRFQRTSTVAASPADATETVIATLNLANFGDIALQSGIELAGFAAFTVGAIAAGAACTPDCAAAASRAPFAAPLATA